MNQPRQTDRLPDSPVASSTAPTAASPVSRPATASSGAVAIWQEKLEYLLQEQAIASDPDQKFRLTKLIAEARQKIAELGGLTR